MKTFKGLIVPHENIIPYDPAQFCVQLEICEGIKCENCLFYYYNKDIFDEWYVSFLRNKKLVRICHEI